MERSSYADRESQERKRMACMISVFQEAVSDVERVRVRRVIRLEEGPQRGGKRSAQAVMSLSPRNAPHIFSYPTQAGQRQRFWAKAVTYVDSRGRSHVVFFSQQEPRAVNSSSQQGANVHHRDVLQNFVMADAERESLSMSGRVEYDEISRLIDASENDLRQRDTRSIPGFLLERSQGFQFTARRNRATGSLEITDFAVDSSITSAQLRQRTPLRADRLAREILTVVRAIDPSLRENLHYVDLVRIQEMQRQGLDMDELNRLLEPAGIHARALIQAR